MQYMHTIIHEAKLLQPIMSTPGAGKSISLYDQPPRSTQHGQLSMGRCNEY